MKRNKDSERKYISNVWEDSQQTKKFNYDNALEGNWNDIAGLLAKVTQLFRKLI